MQESRATVRALPTHCATGSPVARAHDEVRAPPQRFVERHRRRDPAGLGLVGPRRDDPGADRDRPAAEARVAQLLDRGEEGVDVQVQDAAVHARTDT